MPETTTCKLEIGAINLMHDCRRWGKGLPMQIMISLAENQWWFLRYFRPGRKSTVP